MGLDVGDLDRVPAGLGRRELYEKAVSWHRDHGQAVLEKRDARYLSESYVQGYLDLLGRLPDASVAEETDIDYVFLQVLSRLMEWSYHESDSDGVKIAAYAMAGVERRYEGFHDPAFHESARKSALNEPG